MLQAGAATLEIGERDIHRAGHMPEGKYSSFGRTSIAVTSHSRMRLVNSSRKTDRVRRSSPKRSSAIRRRCASTREDQKPPITTSCASDREQVCAGVPHGSR
jgi:hypothetical protein